MGFSPAIVDFRLVALVWAACFPPSPDSPTSTCSFLGLREAPPDTQGHQQLQCNPVPGGRLPSRLRHTPCNEQVRGRGPATGPAVTKVPSFCTPGGEAKMLSADLSFVPRPRPSSRPRPGPGDQVPPLRPGHAPSVGPCGSCSPARKAGPRRSALVLAAARLLGFAGSRSATTDETGPRGSPNRGGVAGRRGALSLALPRPWSQSLNTALPLLIIAQL